MEKPTVYAYDAQQGWSQDDVDINIFDVYDEDETNFTEFDSTSIMQYSVPDADLRHEAAPGRVVLTGAGTSRCPV